MSCMESSSPDSNNSTNAKELINQDGKKSYTFIRRDENGALNQVPFHKYFAEQHIAAAKLFSDCAEIIDNQLFKKYLKLRDQA